MQSNTHSQFHKRVAKARARGRSLDRGHGVSRQWKKQQIIKHTSKKKSTTEIERKFLCPRVDFRFNEIVAADFSFMSILFLFFFFLFLRFACSLLRSSFVCAQQNMWHSSVYSRMANSTAHRIVSQEMMKLQRAEQSAYFCIHPTLRWYRMKHTERR